ncbi:hypothetical protein ACFLWA_01980 [Chloroflexota bacterium]
MNGSPPLAWVRARAKLEPGALDRAPQGVQQEFEHAWAPLQALARLVSCLPDALWTFLLQCDGGYVLIANDRSRYLVGPALALGRTVHNVAYLSLEEMAGEGHRPLQMIGHLIDHYLGCAGHSPGAWLSDGGGITTEWQEAGARLARLYSLGYGVAEEEGSNMRGYFARSLALYCLERPKLNVTDPQIERWFRNVLFRDNLWQPTLRFVGGEDA